LLDVLGNATTSAAVATTNATTPTDLSMTIALSVLGGIYGVTAISAFIFIILPRMMAGQAAIQAVRPAAGVSRPAVRAARPRLPRTRWSPSYGQNMVRNRMRPGSYLPREDIEMTRLRAVPNSRFTVPSQVSLLHMLL